MEMNSYDVQRLCNLGYALSQMACAIAELESMKVANRERESAGHSPAYREEHFLELINKYQLSHNAFLVNMQNGL
jgi:hypothetical protein